MTYGTPEYWQRQAESLGRENANLRRQVDCYGENWNTAIRRLTELGETADWSFWARHLMVLDEMHRLEAEQLERFRLAVVDAVLKLEAANATPERTGLVLPDVIHNANARYRGSVRDKAEANVDARLIRAAINSNQDDLFEGSQGMSDLKPETLADLRALLGDKYVDAIERAAAAMDEGYNPDRYSILTAMFRDYAGAALAAVLPDLLAGAWDEGYEEASDLCHDNEYGMPRQPNPNPYRTEGDPR